MYLVLSTLFLKGQRSHYFIVTVVTILGFVAQAAGLLFISGERLHWPLPLDLLGCAHA